ncbi:nitroreductase [Paracoccus sp. (in: a-proteobacteria)]|uniref:nitroreductase family protein n=1 Tax=Paracoccus sp. TaxID=267 RepID=UPI0026E0380E|nr:nitroreductase [Paracoccus sp. (in: a-proteobacteria)]MDO5647945.1 nitroreductase [Paracoccus sp. (in: a-proteobacteria)]
MTETLHFLATRRSHPPKTLRAPAPDRDELAQLLTLAARVPDHGKLEPWRFIVLGPQARADLAVRVREQALANGQDVAGADKAASHYDSPLIVAVVFSPVDSPKVPEWEQFLSTGAVCVSLVNAALASGWGAAWLTGVATTPGFAQDYLGLNPREQLAGLIHIGTRGDTPPERPRPDIAAKTDWRA